MVALREYQALPVSLLALISVATADQPKAIKKLTPDLGAKLLAEDLGFSLPLISPYEASLLGLDTRDYDETSGSGLDGVPRVYYERAFAPHYHESSHDVLRRAAEALAMLERRSACPAGMSSCANIGSPNKCCQEGTFCTEVDDSTVGGVACCPAGSSCGGSVGNCPSDAVSCPASLGGGCCIAGYVCQGAGCVLRMSTTTEVATTTEDTPPDTITTTKTTVIEGEPSTVVVTLTVTKGPSEEPTTRTSTETVTVSEPEPSDGSSGTATGGAPWRPTSGTDTKATSSTTSATSTTEPPEEGEPTQTGCPTGFYGCLATHGGGCCRTDRNCETASCPAPSSTTIVSNGATIVVAATDVPPQATSTCGDGWFLCGKDAGPVAGCCPSGYRCGTASCFTVQASQTAQVQKEFPEPEESGAGGRARAALVGAAVVVAVLLGSAC